MTNFGSSGEENGERSSPEVGETPRRQDIRRPITALDLPRGRAFAGRWRPTSPSATEKIGFVPNVLPAYAHDNAKLEAFAAFYNDLMLAPSGLSKLEREMIAVAVSAENRCFYCLTAHGAAVRQLSGDPALGELMVDELAGRRPLAAPPRHAGLRGEDDARLARDRRGRPRRRCGTPASANATSGTSPPSRPSTTCRTAWPRPSTCGPTPNTTPRPLRAWLAAWR